MLHLEGVYWGSRCCGLLLSNLTWITKKRLKQVLHLEGVYWGSRFCGLLLSNLTWITKKHLKQVLHVNVEFLLPYTTPQNTTKTSSQEVFRCLGLYYFLNQIRSSHFMLEVDNKKDGGCFAQKNIWHRLRDAQLQRPAFNVGIKKRTAFGSPICSHISTLNDYRNDIENAWNMKMCFNYKGKCWQVFTRTSRS